MPVALSDVCSRGKADVVETASDVSF